MTSSPSELIGRRAELDRLRGGVEQWIANSPAPRVLTIQGPRGVGKTRLYQEIKWQCQQHADVWEAIGGSANVGGWLSSEHPIWQRPNLDEVVRVFETWTARGSLVLCLDNAEQLGRDARRILTALLRMFSQDGRLLAVIAGSWVPALDADIVQPVHLSPLDVDALRQWFPKLGKANVDALHRRTGGFPADIIAAGAGRTASKSNVAPAPGQEARQIEALSPEARDHLAVTLVVGGQVTARVARQLGQPPRAPVSLRVAHSTRNHVRAST